MTSSVSGESVASRDGLWRQLSSMSRPFWMVNIMEMLERLAYYGVRVVIPIYIAQADEIRPFRHPAFWGAFICQGDPSPLKKSMLQ